MYWISYWTWCLVSSLSIFADDSAHGISDATEILPRECKTEDGSLNFQLHKDLAPLGPLLATLSGDVNTQLACLPPKEPEPDRSSIRTLLVCQDYLRPQVTEPLIWIRKGGFLDMTTATLDSKHDDLSATLVCPETPIETQ